MLYAILLTAAIEYHPPVVERVDIIEVNHYFSSDNADGKPTLEQYIFWDYYPFEGEYHVRAWRLVRPVGDDNTFPVPEKNYRTGMWELRFWDCDVLRKVVAPHFEDTWTAYDREVVDRDEVSKDKRPELMKWEKVKK